MSRAVRVLTVLVALALASCASTSTSRLPDAATAVKPVVQVVERIVYVPIDASLTGLEPVAEGPLSACPDVAARRKAALQRCNGKLQSIAGQQGTAKEPEPR